MARTGDRQRMYNAVTLAAVLCMLLAAVLGACAFRGTGPFMADSQAQGGSEAQGWVQVDSVKGNVDVQRAGLAMELLPGTRCCEGDVITVRSGSQTRLAVGTSGAVVLSEGMGASVGADGELKVFAAGDGTGAPEPYQGSATGVAEPFADAGEGKAVQTCAIEIRCDSILAHKGDLKKGKDKYVPEDGVLLARQDVALLEGETAFDVLRRVCEERGLQLEYAYTPAYDAYYVEGIGNLYERDCGRMSGWLFKVDGVLPNYGPSKVTLEPGQVVEWVYTCDGTEAGAGRRAS